MRKMGLDKNYVVGIYNDDSFSTHMSKPEKIKELTEFFTRFKYFGPIVTANSVNEVLDKALEHDVKYCIVQATGHIIQEAAFFRHIEKWIEKQNFFVTGHIMDKNKPNKNNLNFYQSINGKNVLLADSCTAEKKIKLETYSLDYLLEENKIKPIDYISLDTQGSELDIIKGGINTLNKNIVAIELEVSLIEFYENGSSFFEINKF